MKYITLLWLVLASLLGYQCQYVTLSVTGVEPVSTTISGMILQPDGATPAAGARVMLYPADFLFFPQETGLGKISAIRDTMLTNNKGVFTIDTSIKKGFYLIEVMSGNDIVLIDSVEVKGPNQKITMPPATLKPAGAVKGSVVLSGDGNYRDIFVLAFGIDRFTRVNEDGSFCFYNLGEGTYSIRIVSLMEKYGVFDTIGIGVVSTDTTDLGEIVLPFEGIPIPRNLTFTYDTLELKVTLHWNRCNTPNVKGYAIYRRLADSNMVLSNIARQISDDTVMIDSTALQNYRYEYCVAAIGIDEEEGTKSKSVIVTTASHLTVDTVFNLYECEVIPGGGIAVADNGDLYFISDGINVFDRDMHFKRRMCEGYFTGLQKVDIDENGWVFVLCVQSGPEVDYQPAWRSVLYIFDDMGTIIDSIADSTYSNSKITDFDAKDGLIYTMTHYNGKSFYSVAIYTYSGVQLRTWHSETSLRSLAKGGDDKIYAISNNYDSISSSYYVIVFDTLGNTRSRIPIPGLGKKFYLNMDIEYDADREQLYILSVGDEFNQFNDYCWGNVLRVLDRNNNLIATFYKHVFTSSECHSNFKVSGNGDILIYSYWVEPPGQYGGEPEFHKELIRLKPLNR